jgi:hypothetical protein
LGTGLRRDEHETGKHDAEDAKETQRKSIHGRMALIGRTEKAWLAGPFRPRDTRCSTGGRYR